MITAPPPPAPPSTSQSGGAGRSRNFQLQTEDFIKMMVTQLQNQDPMEPAKNQELLAQMSQIGQLQSASTLQESLRGMVLQNQIGSAAALIGREVEGLDENDDPVGGVVSTIRVSGDAVTLELEDGTTLPLNRVTSIAPTEPAGGAGETTGGATPAPGAA